MTFNGMNVMASEYLLEDGEPYQERRTWRERLFTRPWRPLQATRTVVPKVPSTQGYILNGNTILMHPEQIAKLRQQLG